MRTTVVLVLAAALLPASASASSVSLEIASETTRLGQVSEWASVRWTAGSSTQESDTELRIGSGTVALRDSAGTIEPGANCAAVEAGWVRCVSPQDGLGVMVNVQLGDGADRLRVTSEDGSAAGVWVDGGGGGDRIAVEAPVYGSAGGGAGDDVLVGGQSNDTLRGGPGADQIHGGGGDDHITGEDWWASAVTDSAPDLLDGGPGRHDLVDYGARGEGVVVDLQAGAGGAAAGEDALSGIEDVDGGPGADVLRGDDGPNRLDSGYAGGLGDVVEGRGGADTLSASSTLGDPAARISGGDGNDVVHAGGRAQIDAGEGDDTSYTQDAAAAITCGAGDDRAKLANGWETLGVVAADCEEVVAGRFALSSIVRGARRVSFVVRGPYGPTRLCGVRATLVAATRTAAPLASVRGKVPDGGRRRLVLRPRRDLTGPVRVALRGQTCDARGRMRDARHQADMTVVLGF